LAKGPQQATGEDKKAQEILKSTGEIPRHIAIIMDGNGRWAKKRNMPRIAGHSEGVESVRDTVETCGQLGVQYLTLYAFSTENWKRPAEEVSLLMRLLLKALKDETDRLHNNNVRLQAIGDIAALPREVQNELCEDIQKTKDNTGLTLTLALSYSGRWDITRAVHRIVADAKAGKISESDVSDELITSHLSTAGVPDPPHTPNSCFNSHHHPLHAPPFQLLTTTPTPPPNAHTPQGSHFFRQHRLCNHRVARNGRDPFDKPG